MVVYRYLETDKQNHFTISIMQQNIKTSTLKHPTETKS